jgi:formylglycine-generating enzyme required for sulfatase activity
MTSRPLRVFLCHSSNDKPAVRELYQKLRAEPWIEPWLDEEELFPGMDWNMEIEKAIEATDVILVSLSKNSITKEGYVQREIRIALDYADYKPEGTLFIIPVRLEECTPPKRLARWQYADYFKGQRERALQRLLVSLKKRADSLGLKVEQPAAKEMKLIPRDDKEVPDWFTDTANEVLRVEAPASNKITLSNGMEFMRVPAGVFLMGSRGESKLIYHNERPQHSIDIPYDYWIARFSVTNEAYNLYARIKGVGHPVSNWRNKKNHPVVYIKWEEAVRYCQWLNDLLQSEISSGLVLRLPTESEWEKAARGVDGREYPWGNGFDKNRCNTYEGEKGDTTPVGLYSPQGDSPYGCADMAGNVWEWTHSLLKDYPYDLTDGREDEKTSGRRVLRGGSLIGSEGYARCACRYDYDADHLCDRGVGFRVCLAPPLPK